MGAEPVRVASHAAQRESAPDWHLGGVRRIRFQGRCWRRSLPSCGVATRPLQLFNTLTRQVSVFKPRNPPDVGMYSCGPTVYAYQHIGNMRAYVFADTLKRTLTQIRE
jgi:hypothetical protein